MFPWPWIITLMTPVPTMSILSGTPQIFVQQLICVLNLIVIVRPRFHLCGSDIHTTSLLSTICFVTDSLPATKNKCTINYMMRVKTMSKNAFFYKFPVRFMYFYVTLLSHYGIRSDRIYLPPPRLNTCVEDSRDVPEKSLPPWYHHLLWRQPVVVGKIKKYCIFIIFILNTWDLCFE